MPIIERVLPVNQMRQTEYVGAGYCIDGWSLEPGAKAELVEDGTVISFIDSTKYALFSQSVETWKCFVGKQITLSVLISENSSSNAVLWLHCGNNNTAIKSLSGTGLFSVTLRPGNEMAFLKCGIQGRYTTGSVKIQAAKLELGPVQTLAHKEGDTWVLNDPPPNKALELAKCQRYWIRAEGHYSGKIFKNRLYTFIPLPVTMRIVPAVIVENAGAIYSTDGTSHVPTRVGINSVTANGIKVFADMPNDAPGIGVWLDSKLIFDAKL